MLDRDVRGTELDIPDENLCQGHYAQKAHGENVGQLLKCIYKAMRKKFT